MTSLTTALEIQADIQIGGPCNAKLAGPRNIKLFGNYAIIIGNVCDTGSTTVRPFWGALDKDNLAGGFVS
jgi:hypothetical protein